MTKGLATTTLLTPVNFGCVNRPGFELTPRSWTNFKGFAWGSSKELVVSSCLGPQQTSAGAGYRPQPMGWTPPTRTGIDVPKWKCQQALELKGASTMKISTVGIDLAKNVFQVHAVDEHGKVAWRKQLRRDQMTAFFVNLPPCLIGMEACGSAHHWARTLQGFGHTVHLMSPQFVKPYVKSNADVQAANKRHRRARKNPVLGSWGSGVNVPLSRGSCRRLFPQS